MQLPNHGANPEHLAKQLEILLQANAIDFSVNTTPLPLQTQISENWQSYLETITKYPDPTSEQLTAVIAEKEGLSPHELLVGNGAAQLIFLLALFFQRKRVAIVEPSFSEYRDACQIFNCEIEGIFLNNPWKLDVTEIIAKSKQKDLLFICNPNNPTGVAYSLQEIEYVIEKLEPFQVTVVIDEAFYDFQENGPTLIKLVKNYQNVIVLRSLTKMYGIAGLRLGYIAANPSFIQKLRLLQAPWSVNGLVQRIGCDCLQDLRYPKEVQKYCKSERQRIFPLLREMGYEVSNSVVNFYLLKEKTQQGESMPLLKFLLQQGIVPRHTYNFPSLDGRYLRLAVKTVSENNQLLAVLARWKEQC